MPETLTVAIKHLAHPHETVSGDASVSIQQPTGYFAAVIDGLGHGQKAHQAAQVALNALAPLPAGSLSYLMQHCHKALTGTRGAVISMARIDTTQNTLQWLGVGNVTGVILKKDPDPLGNLQRDHLLTRGGIVGFRLPTMREYSFDFAPGDTLIMATDGIKSQFLEELPRNLSPEETAETIMTQHRRKTDDSLVLILKYLPE